MIRKNLILILIIVTAIVARLYGLDLELLSPEQKASVMFSVAIGVLSVFGLYLLVKEIFDEKLAALSSFLLATSFWHVLISKLGAKDIFASFVLIFAFYFIWHGLKYGRTFDFFLAGLFGGAGFYTGKGYFVAPLVVLLVFWNYWDYVKKDFSLSKYAQTKTTALGGFSLLAITVIAVILPVVFFIWQTPSFILLTDNSIFSTAEPFALFYQNIKWMADKILFIEFAPPAGGANLVSWPITVFFVLGLIKELLHWLKRKHGHFSVAHTFIFSWLFIMPIPVLLSASQAGEPSVLGLSIILPPIMLLSAQGLWWVIEKLNRWDHLAYPRPHKHWKELNAGPVLALTALMISIALLELF